MYVLLLSAKCVLLVVSCLFVCLEAVGEGGGGGGAIYSKCVLCVLREQRAGPLVLKVFIAVYVHYYSYIQYTLQYIHTILYIHTVYTQCACFYTCSHALCVCNETISTQTEVYTKCVC